MALHLTFEFEANSLFFLLDFITTLFIPSLAPDIDGKYQDQYCRTIAKEPPVDAQVF